MEREPFGAQFDRFAGFIAEQIGRRANTEIKGKENLELARLHLQCGGRIAGAVVPHTKIFDPLIADWATNKHLIQGIPNVKRGWLISDKFTREIKSTPEINFPFADRAGRAWLERRGIIPFPVVQRQYFEELTPEDVKKAEQLNSRSIRGAYDLLQDTPSSIILLSPEGTRNKEYGLLRAEGGVGLLLKANRTLLLPIILKGMDNLSLARPAANITVEFGKLTSKSEAMKIARGHQWNDDIKARFEREGNKTRFTSADAIMLHIARQELEVRKLGHDPAGVYSESNLIKSS